MGDAGRFESKAAASNNDGFANQPYPNFEPRELRRPFLVCPTDWPY
jgi:hypothetical protein